MDNENLTGNVYLYQRFSSSKQEGNSSLYRQTEAQNAWLARHPKCKVVTLDDEPLIDAGISAYTGKNVKEGSLGRLVQAIESGAIEKGSIILVEHFSRLSRMDIDNTEELVRRIWKHGISIVTARGNNYYPPEAVNDSRSRIGLILEIEAAHADSKWRSEKVKSSWERREVDAKERGVVPRMRMPFWLNKEGKLNEFKKIVRDIFKFHAQGLGQVLIERAIREKYYDEFKERDDNPLKNINPTKIIRIIQNEKCIGMVYEKKLYDHVVSDDTFYTAQRICRERLYTSVRQNRKWPLHGIVKCGSCGSGMSIQQTNGSLPLLRCSRKQRSGGEHCSSSTTFPYVVAYHFFNIYVEPIILATLSDNQRHALIETKIVEINHKLTKVRASLAEAQEVYKNRKNLGKSITSTLYILDDLQGEIDTLSQEKVSLQKKVNAQKTMASISKSILELSNSSVQEYNLELNKSGSKIKLKDNTLSFSIDNESTIASLKYLKYDRKKKAYLYEFRGNTQYFKEQSNEVLIFDPTNSHMKNKSKEKERFNTFNNPASYEGQDLIVIGEIRSQDWTIERLLDPKNYNLKGTEYFASTMHNLYTASSGSASFKISDD
tara:strand:- start:617 stop:2428 length:1812 start_codon:yes stop_codon:yes gene_type:complete